MFTSRMRLGGSSNKSIFASNLRLQVSHSRSGPCEQLVFAAPYVFKLGHISAQFWRLQLLGGLPHRRIPAGHCHLHRQGLPERSAGRSSLERRFRRGGNYPPVNILGSKMGGAPITIGFEPWPDGWLSHPWFRVKKTRKIDFEQRRCFHRSSVLASHGLFGYAVPTARRLTLAGEGMMRGPAVGFFGQLETVGLLFFSRFSKPT